MAALFQKKKGGKTVAIIDVESGSVGAALARLSRHEAPKLFAETRVMVPLLHTRDVQVLAREVERATRAALAHVSAVATRVRQHSAASDQGVVERAAIFFSPPWAAMHLAGGTADFVEPLRKSTHLNIRSSLGEIPTTFHPLGTAAAHGTRLLYPYERPSVVCIVNAEVSELLIMTGNELMGRATVPVGTHTLLRTLVSHTGMTPAEARSFIGLPHREDHTHHEPLFIAEDEFAAHIEDAARELAGTLPLFGIIVVAHEPFSELLARALARSNRLANLFPEGGTVRAARTTHAMPYIAAHAKKPDLHIMLETLFVDAKFGGI